MKFKNVHSFSYLHIFYENLDSRVIVSLEIEKAFDLVDLEYIERVLYTHGFWSELSTLNLPAIENPQSSPENRSYSLFLFSDW